MGDFVEAWMAPNSSMRKRIAILHVFLLVAVGICAGQTAVQGQGSRPVAGEKKLASVSDATDEVIFGALKPYSHSRGWFSISTPGNWTVTDTSADAELVVSIIDPTENAVVVIRVWTNQTQSTPDERAKWLTEFLNKTMSEFPAFSSGELRPQSDGSTGLFFKYDSVVKGKTYLMYGNSFIEQKGKLVGLITVIIPANQYNGKKDATHKLINSFRLNPEAVR